MSAETDPPLPPPHKLLIDTSVWLDLAKDHRQQPLLDVFDTLWSGGYVSFIVPQVLLDEFARNKDRVAEEAARSHSSVFKRVRDAVSRYGDDPIKNDLIRQLNEIDHRIGSLGQGSSATIDRIERVLGMDPTIPTSDAVKIRAADRAITGRAPFHRPRNGIGDAVLIETYADALASETDDKVQFVFVTHNTKDFSDTARDNRLPHPDIAEHFASDRSSYSISIAETLKKIAPDLVEEYQLEFEWVEEPRRLSEIGSAIDLLFDQVWYNRHWNLRADVEAGRKKLVEVETFPVTNHATRPVQEDVWTAALAAAKRVEERRGLDQLGPWTDFEWGMINGKLSALRWVLGDEWDMLDT